VLADIVRTACGLLQRDPRSVAAGAETRPDPDRGRAPEIDRSALLLKEYETSGQRVGHYTALVWQTALVLLVLSVAGSTYLVVNLPADFYGVLVVGASALIALVALIGWFVLAERWSHLARVHDYRSQEIEAEIGLRVRRYVDCLDAAAERRDMSFPPSPEEAPAFGRLLEQLPHRAPSPRLDRQLRIALVLLTVLTWCNAFIFQAVSTLLYGAE
jgi:hypothetical protein